VDAVLYAVAAMSVILIARHRTNIVKLARGEESRIGRKKPEKNSNTETVS
jgi:glycerol-3-phosphate acyltransferase PlsY